MRFKATEYKDIQAIITKAKLDPLAFTNVKKRGRVHIQYQSGPIFIFFRRTAMVLNEQKQWTRESHYEVGAAKALLGKDLDWPAVLKLFRKWIKEIQQQPPPS